jgi:hypothetical protein
VITATRVMALILTISDLVHFREAKIKSPASRSHQLSPSTA